MTSLTRLYMNCPRCHEEVTYEADREVWVGDNDTRCRMGGDLPGGHKAALDGALVVALTMDGINGLIRKLTE